MDKAALETVLSTEQARFIEEWETLLSFPSIGTEPEHDGDCRACAEWLLAQLQAMGCDGRLIETSSKPLVFAERAGAADKPTILFYGHYDVQPVDPVEQWTTAPFEPTWRDGRLYARGAQDNKGQLFYVLKAIETLIALDALDATIKVIIEGEEESGSGGISAALPDLAKELAADILMVCDTGTVASGEPTIIMGLRGVAFVTARLTGADRDLHSGVHGGVCRNPATEMARLVATLHDDQGRIAVAGFYDEVVDPTEEERALANALPFDPDSYKRETGATPQGGEAGFSAAERVGFRPALDINGIHSGYGGAGSKTIIPAEALVKISARLAANQDPQRSLDAIVDHLRTHTPAGMRLDIDESGVGGAAFRVSPTSPPVVQAAEVLRQLDEREPALLWEGASIPILPLLAETSGAQPLLVGFGAEADNIHAPNESFSKEQFRLGFLYAGLFLANVT